MAAPDNAASGPERPLRVLTLPAEGETERVPFVPDQDLKLTFDQAASSFDRSGSDLVITSEKTGTLILSDFCNPDHAGQLPRFILVSGDVVAGEDLVAVLDPETLPPPSAGNGIALGHLSLEDLFGGPEKAAEGHTAHPSAFFADAAPSAPLRSDEDQSAEYLLLRHGLNG